MSHDRHKSNTKAAVPSPHQISGAPRASRQSDKGLVAVLASAPGSSVKALQGQLLLCTVLGVLLLAVLLSLTTDAHTRARLYPPSMPLLPSQVRGRVGASGAEGRAESDADAPASDSDSNSNETWDSETRAEREEGAEAGAGSESGTAAEARAGAGQGRQSPRLGRRGAGGRARRSTGWPHIFSKGQGAMSFLFGRHQHQRRKARGRTRGTPVAKASPGSTTKHRGRALDTQALGPPPVAVGKRRRHRPLPRWVPQAGKYFLAFCQMYRWTNRLICMEKALVLAVLLNRTLILPQRDVCDSSPKPQNSDHMLVDVQHLRECLAQGILTKESTSGTDRERGGERGREIMGAGSATSAAAGASLLQGGLAEEAARGGWLGQIELERQARQLLAVHERLASYGVVTLQEYQEALGVRTVTPDMLLCDKLKCPMKGCDLLGILQFANHTIPPVWLYRRHLTKGDLRILRRITGHAHVLSFGDLFYTRVRDYPLPLWTSLRRLLGTSCPLPVRPHQDIFQLADDLAQKHFKGPYAALHLRRRDFKKYLGFHSRPYWSIRQVADCVASEMTKLGLSVLFLATDALNRERRRLRALLGARNITSPLYRPGRLHTSLTQALVDKVMCARAEVFLYERLSTFSWHILQLRDGLGRSSSHDKPLCAGRNSSFIPQAV